VATLIDGHVVEAKLTVIAEDPFKDNISYESKTYADLKRLNTALLSASEHWILCVGSSKCLEVLGKFKENIDTIHCELGKLETLTIDQKVDARKKQVEDKIKALTKEVASLRRLFFESDKGRFICTSGRGCAVTSISCGGCGNYSCNVDSSVMNKIGEKGLAGWNCPSCGRSYWHCGPCRQKSSYWAQVRVEGGFSGWSGSSTSSSVLME